MMAHAELGDRGLFKDNPYSDIKHQGKGKQPPEKNPYRPNCPGIVSLGQTDLDILLAHRHLTPLQ
jgi:hypothetical protein